MTMRNWVRGLLAAAFLLLPAGCLDSQVSTVTTGKEFRGEENLDAIRKGIIGWQTTHMDSPLPDSLSEISNVPAEFRNAPGGLADGYIYLFLKSGDNAHYVLMAYPKQHGFNGERTFFLADMGAVKARDLGKDYDHGDWDYDSAVEAMAR